MASNGREIEIKLAVPDVDEARRRLRKAGFRLVKQRVLERNTVYDTEGFDLRRGSKMLRLREAAKRSILTFKGAPEPGKHKSREEIETGVADPAALRGILARLGYAAAFRYEKFRTEFAPAESKGAAKVIATLDETPIGTYLELEGEPEGIDRAARMLGFAEKDYITASYARLFIEWRERNGSGPADMLFEAVSSRDRGTGDERTGN
jgi:adenylate cyclase, class 2